MNSISFRPTGLVLLLLILAAGFLFGICKSQRSLLAPAQPIWSDEFDYEGYPDSSRWGYDLGGHGWGNKEMQLYTQSLSNARVEDGILIIEAHQIASSDTTYTSARLVTRGRQTWNRGRIEVRAKLPTGRGVWPAIWMLGEDIREVGWPLCGEIDIMENVGYNPDTLHATVHTKSFNHVAGTQRSSRIYKAGIHDHFHVYSLDWRSDKLVIGVDGQDYFSFSKLDSSRASWPFDVPHYLLLNVAVGGAWGGKFGVDSTDWPRRMEVDWVRVYP